jgi:hypothetical protein
MLFDFFIHRQSQSNLPHDLFEKKMLKNDKHLARQIEKISELLAFITVYDPGTMIELNTWFEEISNLASNSSQPQVSTMAVAAARISEELILQDSPTQETDDIPQADLVRQIQDHIQERLVEVLVDMGVNVTSPQSHQTTRTSSKTKRPVSSLG